MRNLTPRTLAGITAAALGALTLTACGADEPVADLVAYSAPTATWDTPDTGMEKAYLIVLETEGIELPDPSVAIDLGYSVCDYFDDDGNIIEAGLIGIESGFTSRQSGTIVGAAIAAFCPRHADVLAGLR